MWLWGSVLVIMVIPCILFVLGVWLSFKSELGRDKSSPYECGFEAISSARSSFSMRFFLLAVMFVVFDVEVVLMVPILFGVSGNIQVAGFVSLMLFVLILVLGCVYERRDGSMDWISEL
uniref:NADH dehydrogenase subunit 3 n=1 Tax=Modiolus modulaides TaxID=2784319 RepID=UPI002238300F|nr:NADH dehydrogenase subunit 3 [Modiolus modulaides]UYA96802.1 NADH dehydrogenase subunit 3 [Modiolus modulaides]